MFDIDKAIYRRVVKAEYFNMLHIWELSITPVGIEIPDSETIMLFTVKWVKWWRDQQQDDAATFYAYWHDEWWQVSWRIEYKWIDKVCQSESQLPNNTIRLCPAHILKNRFHV